MSELETLTVALADRYAIERQIGAGGMATVYLAKDLKHDRNVAVKVLREDLSASLGKERFLREIKVAAALQHPHVLPLYDSGEANGLLYYVMPFVEGMSLREKLVKGGRAPRRRRGANPPRRGRRALGGAQAWRGAPRPQARKRDAARQARARDGLRRGEGAERSDRKESLTTIGVALGTPTYMAPEQATADPHVDHRADIYAFGVMAYELLAGRPPFAGMTPQQVLAAHVTSAAEPVTTHRNVSPVLAQLVMKCLEKKPADRRQSADELIPQLESVLTPSGGMTPAETAPYPRAQTSTAEGKPTRGLAIGLAIGVSVLLVAAAGFYFMRAGRDTPLGGVGTPVWIAVLPPENQGRPSEDWFADGLADEIRGALARIPGAQVKGSRSSQSYKGSTKAIPQIAGELGVTYVVTSKVRWEPTGGGDGRVIVSAELLDGRSETVKGRQSYDTTLSDLYGGQVAVAQRAARDLSAFLHLVPDTSVRVVSRATSPPKVNPEAYAAYLAGRAEFNRFTTQSRDHSIELFTRATGLDSTFAKAHAWLAIAMYTRGVDPRDGTAEQAAAAVRQANILGPDDPDALVARSYLDERTWDWKAMRADVSRALERDPASTWARDRLVTLEEEMGNFDRALEVAKRNAETDPVVVGDVPGVVLADAGRMDEALAYARAGLALDSMATANCWYCIIAEVLAIRGDVAGTRAAYARNFALRGESLPAHVEGVALARAGRRPEARAIVAKLRATADSHPAVDGQLAIIFAALGENDSAFVWLNKRVDGKIGGAGPIATSAYLIPLRSDPRYTAVLKRTGLR